MLVSFGEHFVDIIREKGYRDLLTVRSSSPEALAQFEGLSMSNILQVPHHIYTSILHVSEDAMRLEHPKLDISGIEVFQRLTPAPIAYAYEWVIDHGEAGLEGTYWYCWADEVDSTRDDLLRGEDDLAGEPRFYPLFYIPGELVGAPLKFEFEFEENEEDEE